MFAQVQTDPFLFLSPGSKSLPKHYSSLSGLWAHLHAALKLMPGGVLGGGRRSLEGEVQLSAH